MNKYIYYNDKKIAIGSLILEKIENETIIHFETVSNAEFTKAIQQFLAMPSAKNLIIVSSDFKVVYEKLKKQLYFIEAAGGLIQKDNTYLFIKRLGKWDLPKGKLDTDETPEKAAIRECEEECDVHNLTIKNQLECSYHIYSYKKGYALKTTYWYFMTTNYNKTLKPQTEENIEEVKWFTKNEIETTVMQNTYPTIKNLITAYFASKA